VCCWQRWNGVIVKQVLQVFAAVAVIMALAGVEVTDARFTGGRVAITSHFGLMDRLCEYGSRQTRRSIRAIGRRRLMVLARV
jgi:hypothetical protein